jgi:hypothetical protein
MADKRAAKQARLDQLTAAREKRHKPAAPAADMPEAPAPPPPAAAPVPQQTPLPPPTQPAAAAAAAAAASAGLTEAECHGCYATVHRSDAAFCYRCGHALPASPAWRYGPRPCRDHPSFSSRHPGLDGPGLGEAHALSTTLYQAMADPDYRSDPMEHVQDVHLWLSCGGSVDARAGYVINFEAGYLHPDRAADLFAMDDGKGLPEPRDSCARPSVWPSV